MDLKAPKVWKELELRNLKVDKATLTEPGRLMGRLRRRKDGQISITWQYKFHSPTQKKDRSIAVGTWPAVGMAQIRKNRDGYMLQVRSGLDPQEEKEREHLLSQHELETARLRAEQDQAEEKTMSDMFEWYIDGLNHADGNKAFQGNFDNHIKPEIGHIAVKDLTPDGIRKCLRKIVAKGKNRTAEIAFENLRAVLRNGEKEQPWRRLLIEMNPIDVIQIDRILSPDYEGYRDRFLSLDEIKKLDKMLYDIRYKYENAAPGTKQKLKIEWPIKKRTELAIWLVLSTLTRITETTLAKWEDVDFDKCEWFIPRENVKRLNGNVHKAHLIYLSDFTFNILKQLHQLTGHTPWLFPNEKGTGPLNNKTITKQIGDRQALPGDKPKKGRRHSNSLLIDGERWTPHDLRRTGATQMQALGIDLDCIDRCQNHVLNTDKNRSRKHYMHHQYSDEMRDAWIKWGNLLATLAPRALKDIESS